MAVHRVLFIALASLASGQESLLHQAARFDSEHKCTEAEQAYQQALTHGSTSQALLNNLGNHYLLCGDPAKARTYFERLVKANPQHANGNLQLARIAVDQHQGTRALDYLSRVNDTQPQILLLRAEALHWADQPAAARAMLDRVQRESAADLRLTYLYGITCARMAAYDRAVAALNAVLAQHPNDFDVLFNLGRAAARAGKNERALRALEVAVKLQPRNVEALMELAAVNATLGDYTRSVYLLVQARQISPDRPEIALGLAHAAQSGEYYGDAALAYDSYLRLKPDDESARRDRALVCGFTQSRQAEGLKDLQEYVQRHPRDPLGHHALAQLTWRGHPEQAIESLQTALRLDPNLAAAHVNLAWLLNRLGRTAEAIPHFEKAVELNPRDARALDQLGAAYTSADRAADAERVLRKALTLSPENTDILMHLGRALMDTGHEEEGRAYLERFRKTTPARARGPWQEAGMIESASLSPAERTKREIERLRNDARTHQDDPELQMRFASLLLTDGRVDEAETEYRVLLASNAQSRIFQQAGVFLLRFERYGLAREFLERAAASNASANLDLATAVLYIDGPDKALTVLERTPENQRPGDWLLLKAKILDAAGQAANSEKVLEEGLRQSVSRPQIAREAALLLVRHGRNQAALEFLAKAETNDPELLLTRASILALIGQTDTASKLLNQIESSWPEWDRPYVVHGLLLEKTNRTEAKKRLGIAVALGSRDPAIRCGLARLNPGVRSDAACTCEAGLREMMLGSCTRTTELHGGQ